VYRPIAAQKQTGIGAIVTEVGNERRRHDHTALLAVSAGPLLALSTPFQK
jgi:hypothetical protein